jgi:uncharacterized protein YdiU (UPF0061 family)
MISSLEAAEEIVKSVSVLRHRVSFQPFQFGNNPGIVLWKLKYLAWTFVVVTKPKNDSYQGLKLNESNWITSLL